MTVAAQDQSSTPQYPVNLARALTESARHETNTDRLIELAGQLRAIGRPDLAFEAIERAPADQSSSKFALYERARILQALGYYEKAQAEVARLRSSFGLDAQAAALSLAIADKAGSDPLVGCDGAALADAIRSTGDLRLLISAISYGSLEATAFGRILRAGFRVDKSSAVLMSWRFAAAKIQVMTAKLFAAGFLQLVSLAAGGRKVHVASMGKFTRLADLVDRVDPLLRTLASDGGSERHRLVVLFFGGYPNRQLFEMYRRHCTIVQATSRVARKLATMLLATLRLAGRSTEITTDYRRIGPPFLNYPAVLTFHDDERARIERGLEKLGIDASRPFVVFGLRDMAYYQFYGDVMSIPLEQQGRRASTHHRCPPLQSYVRAAEYWAGRNHQVVRMGLRVSERLPEGLDGRITDYASMERSDEMDAYLFARCWFMIAGDTGLFSGAAAFDRPSVLSDLHLVQNTMYSSNKRTRNIFVPKLIRDVRKGTLLSFREHIYWNHSFAYFEDCQRAGLEIIHNEPEDIIEASIELTERLEGRYIETAEIRQLQRAYHAIYPPSFIGHKSTALVSAAFLKKYSYLLD